MLKTSFSFGVMVKRLIKGTVPYFPGYHPLCCLIRGHKPPGWEWINRLPVKPGIQVLVHSSVGDFYLSCPERCSIAKKFFWTRGVHEPGEDRTALEMFARLSKKADVVLDIGANSGLFSLVAARANSAARIMAFDIFPEAYHVLADNLILNGLLERVDLRLTGVGKKGTVFNAPFGHITSEMPTSLSLDCQGTKGAVVRVPVKTLDEICLPSFAGKKMCIKIDVEGTEVDIFSCGLETLSVIKPDIICEVLPSARDVGHYDHILTERSYIKYLITDEGLRRCDKVAAHMRYKDWFFTAQEDLGTLGQELLLSEARKKT